MACIEADGSLTATGRALLEGLVEEPMAPEDVAKKVNQPVFKVRGSLRELAQAGLIEAREGTYAITDQGRERMTP
jgi:predicted transcriptional regulator